MDLNVTSNLFSVTYTDIPDFKKQVKMDQVRRSCYTYNDDNARHLLHFTFGCALYTQGLASYNLQATTIVTVTRANTSG